MLCRMPFEVNEEALHQLVKICKTDTDVAEAAIA